MNTESEKYNAYVRKGVLALNQFGITDIHDIASLHSRYFDRKEYPSIEALIKKGNIEALKALPPNSTDFAEYLDIMMFKDQTNKQYIVTMYDSIELSQDPQVIEVYSL